MGSAAIASTSAAPKDSSSEFPKAVEVCAPGASAVAKCRQVSVAADNSIPTAGTSAPASSAATGTSSTTPR